MSYAQFWNQQYQPPASLLGPGGSQLGLGQQMLDKSKERGFAVAPGLQQFMEEEDARRERDRYRVSGPGAGMVNIAPPGRPPMWVPKPPANPRPNPVPYQAYGVPYKPVSNWGPGGPPATIGGWPQSPSMPTQKVGRAAVDGSYVAGDGSGGAVRTRDLGGGSRMVPYTNDGPAQPAYMGGYGRRRMTSPQPRFGFF